MQQTVAGFPTLNLPDVCTDSPVRGKAFCRNHCALLEREAPDVPTDLRGFLQFCGAKANGMSICVCGICVHRCLFMQMMTMCVKGTLTKWILL